MTASNAVSRPAGHRTGHVVAAITSADDLPLVLVAAAQADRRGTALTLVHARSRRDRQAADPDVERTNGALRDRALTLAQLSGVPVTWTPAIGRPDDVLAQLCRETGAALIVVGATRRQLATWRRRRVIAAARRLKRRAHTPIHIVTT